MWLGVHATERISSLVLCCTSPYLGPPDRWQERMAAPTLDNGRQLTRAAMRDSGDRLPLDSMTASAVPRAFGP